MAERTIRPRQREGGPSSLDGPFADPLGDAEPDDERVVVGTNLFHEPLPVAGMTVAEVRQRMSTRLDIDPRSVAVLDGDAVDDESVRVRGGQLLTFIRSGGEKGAGDVVRAEGRRVEAVSPEGVTASMEVEAFVRGLAPDRLDTGDLVLPDGVRAVRSHGGTTVVVWELPPRVCQVRWIADDSPAPFSGAGRGKVKYRKRRLALPYIVVFAVFTEQGGRLHLAPCNEAYFRTGPIKRPGDGLCFPALLNVSFFPARMVDSHPLSWICTQYLDFMALAAAPDVNDRIRSSLAELRRTLLDAAFNYSSEHHEAGSWWTASAREIDSIADLDRWEALSRERPDFVLDVPWLEARWKDAPVTVESLIERIFSLNGAAPPAQEAGDLARVVLNQDRPDTARESAA